MTQEPEWASLGRQSMGILKDPYMLAKSLEDSRQLVIPRWLELIEEGMADGSIRTEYPHEAAELLSLLNTLWISPAIFPAAREGVLRKFHCAMEIFAHLGVPVIDDEMIALADKFFQMVPPELM